MIGGQFLSAALAWTIAGLLFLAALAVVYRRTDVPWKAMVVFISGSMMLAVAGGMAALHAAVEPEGALPDAFLTLIIVARATSAAIFLGLVVYVSGRPRWVVRLVSRLVD
jgi:hypothetical protein